MDTLLYSVIPALLIILFIVLYKLHEYSQERTLYLSVSWCMETDNLITYVLSAQKDLRKDYHINDTDWDYLRTILAEYQKDLATAFLKRRLNPIRCKYVMEGENYFMLTLNIFLRKHEDTHEFFGHRMHGEKSPSAPGTYFISDFALVYHKLCYISNNVCKNSKAVLSCKNDGIAQFLSGSTSYATYLSKILETKQIKK